MEFLAVCRRRTETFSDAEFAPRLDTEALRLRELYAEGVVRSAWSREAVPGACLLAESASLDEAQSKLVTLPLVALVMLEANIIPLRGYRGFCP